MGWEEAERHRNAGNRPSSERIKRHTHTHTLLGKEGKKATREMHTSRRTSHAVKERRRKEAGL